MNAKYETHSHTSKCSSASLKQQREKRILEAQTGKKEGKSCRFSLWAICTLVRFVMLIHFKFHYSNHIGVVGARAVLGGVKERAFPE